MTPKPPKLIPKRPVRRGFMTIAAGFQFNRGVLLCADTQYTGGSIKFFQSKLYQSSGTNGSGMERVDAVVAASGSDGYMQAVVSQCEETTIWNFAFREGDEGNAGDKLREKLEDTLCAYYEKHIYKHPHYGYTGGPL